MFTNKRLVAAHSIRPVQEFNEVLCHLLEATEVHLHFTRKKAHDDSGAHNVGGVGDVQMGGMGGMSGMSGMGGGVGVGSGGGMANDRAQWAGLTPVQRRIMEFLVTADTEGAHCDIISQKTRLPIKEVHTARDELVGKGKVYTTVDDDTLALMNF